MVPASCEQGRAALGCGGGKRERFFDDRFEIAVFNMGNPGKGDKPAGEYLVPVPRPRFLDAVGSKEKRCGNAVELPLLVLPCGAEVPGQMGEF